MGLQGLVEWRRSATESVEVFFVWKRNHKMRLILDGRQAGLHFRDLDHVNLATGGSFGSLEVDGGEPIWVGSTDIADAFYALALPPDLIRFFGVKALEHFCKIPDHEMSLVLIDPHLK